MGYMKDMTDMNSKQWRDRRRFAWFGLVISLLFLTLFVLVNFKGLTRRPWQWEQELSAPARVRVSDDGHVVVYGYTEEGASQLLEMDRDGRLVWSLYGNHRGFNEFFHLRRYIVSDTGDIYAVNNVPDLKNGAFTEQRLIKIDRRSRAITTLAIFQRSDGQTDFSDVGAVWLGLAGGRLYYLYLNDERNFTIYRYNFADRSNEPVVRHASRKTLAKFAGYGPESLYLVYDDASIARFSLDGKLHPVTVTGLASYYLWPIRVDAHGNLSALELLSQTIYRISTPDDIDRWQLTPILSKQSIASRREFFGSHPVFTDFDRTPGGVTFVLDISTKKFIGATDDGTRWILGNSWRYPPGEISDKISIAGIFLLLLTISIGFLYFLYVRVYHTKMSLVLKMVLVLAPTLAISISAVSRMVVNKYEEKLVNGEENLYMLLADIGASRVSGDDVGLLTHPADIHSAVYARIKKAMKFFAEEADTFNVQSQGFRANLYTARGDTFFLTDAFGIDFLYPYEVSAECRKTFADGRIRVDWYANTIDKHFSAFAPIRNSRGEIVGVYEITRQFAVFGELQGEARHKLIGGIILAEVLFIALFAVFIFMLLRNLRVLRRFVDSISQNRPGRTIQIASHDEIADLGGMFNHMSSEINRHIVDIEELTNANARFVPQEFLTFLGKSVITEVQLGDQAQHEMTILFAGIKSFRELAKTMSNEEQFNFLNAYLARISPLIQQHHGFIDKYISDAVMALFPRSPADAIRCAMAIHQVAEEYNTERRRKKRQPVEIGMGLHTGQVMLGIIGETRRFEGTVIADAVNLAARLKNLAKTYRTSIVASGDLIDRVEEMSGLHWRELDVVRVKGKSKPVRIIEIIPDPSAPAQRRHVAGE